MRESWNLESFLDSLVLQLDRAQDTLALKGMTRKLSYMVKDIDLDLQIFPRFEKGNVQFATAGPNESGASKLSIQLGSITDRQIKDTTKKPISRDDISIDMIEDLDEDVKKSLQEIGVNSVEDVERLEKRNVDINRIVEKKTGKSKKSYSKLADMLKKARRQKAEPKVFSVTFSSDGAGEYLELDGDNMRVLNEESNYPEALINGKRVKVLSAGKQMVRISLPEEGLKKDNNVLKVLLDPYSIIDLEIRERE